jgi:ferredoxin
MHITVKRDLCIGVGNCVELAPDVFDQSEDDGTVVLLQEDVDDALVGDVTQAAEVCPVHAILLGAHQDA